MARLSLKLRPGRQVQVGDAVITVKYARRGEAHLVVEAPRSVPIVRLERESAEPSRSTSTTPEARS